MIVKEFKMPLDASLFNFKWSDSQEIGVTYGTECIENKITIVVSQIKIGFSLMWELNNMVELRKQIEAAALHNATTFWRERPTSHAIDLSNINANFRGTFAGIINH